MRRSSSRTRDRHSPPAKPVRTQLQFESLEDRSLPSAYSYLVVADSDSSLPAHFAQRIHNAGGEVRYTIPQIGVALVNSEDRGFHDRAEHIPGIRSVVFAGLARSESTDVPPVLPPQPPLGPNVPVTPDEFSSLQWNLDAIDAEGAWAQGVNGNGVRVAILDSGFMGNHADLHFNRALSSSMVDGEPSGSWANPDPDLSGVHGTMVAGVIGALDNGEGTVGVAPRADLVAIKVFDDSVEHLDGVDVVAAMRGIVYATNIHSDVINMSFIFHYDKAGWIYDPENTPDDPTDDVVETPQETAAIVGAFQRATDYAYDHGVTIIACAGNDAVDHDQHLDEYYFPQGLPHVITVSGTGPLGIANDPETDLDVPGFYTDYGRSYIDLAAPGGNIDFDLLESGQTSTIFGIEVPAFLRDWVFTTANDPFPDDFPDIHIQAVYQTSFASPHVAAVAALVIEANDGHMDPDEVFKILKRTADDLGEPGKDAYYGHGRVNAAAAIARVLDGHHRHHGYGQANAPATKKIGEKATQPGGKARVAAFLPPANVTVVGTDTFEVADLVEHTTRYASDDLNSSSAAGIDHSTSWLDELERPGFKPPSKQGVLSDSFDQLRLLDIGLGTDFLFAVR